MSFMMTMLLISIAMLLAFGALVYLIFSAIPRRASVGELYPDRRQRIAVRLVNPLANVEKCEVEPTRRQPARPIRQQKSRVRPRPMRGS